MKLSLLAILFFTFDISQSRAGTSQPKNPYLKKFVKNEGLEIRIPTFVNRGWEESLVTYAIEFKGADLKEEDLILKKSNQSEIPFQLSEIRKDAQGYLSFARLSFITEHKKGNDTVFNLVKGSPKNSDLILSKIENDNGVVIDNGKIKILVSKTLNKPNNNEPVPAPILGVDNGKGWQALPKVLGDNPKLISINSETQENGKVFLIHKVDYNFIGGSKYELIIKVVRGQEKIEIIEKFKGLNKNFASDSLSSIERFIKSEGNHNLVTLDEAKDWIFLNDTQQKNIPSEFLLFSLQGRTNEILENAYIKSSKDQSLITEYDCLELAETGFLFPEHPLSREWLDQSEKILRNKKARSTSLPQRTERLGLILECVIGLQSKEIKNYGDIKKPLGIQPNGSIILTKNKNNEVRITDQGEIKLKSKENELSSLILTSSENENSLPKKSFSHIDLKDLVMSNVTFSNNQKFETNKRVLNVNDRYSAIIEDLSSPNSKIVFSGKTTKPKIFFARPHGNELKINEDKPLEISLSGKINDLNGVTVIPMTEKISVNKVTLNSTPVIANSPLNNVTLIDTDQGSDRLFIGKRSENIRLNGKGWSVNSSLALIRELGTNKKQLSVFGNNKDLIHSISSDHLTLEVEGSNVAATAEYRIPKKSKTRDPIVFNSSGSYYAPEGGTLRIMFGKNSQTSDSSGKSLLAFWKFDEGKGNEFGDIKNPEKKAILKNNNKVEWVEGIGFEKGSAVRLNPSTQIDTAFEKEIPRNSSISIWVKTTKSGSLLNLIQDKTSTNSHTKILEVTKDGMIKVSQNGNNPFEIIGESKINDGKWHHITWVTKEFLDENIVDQSLLKHSLYIDSKLQKETSIKENIKDKKEKYKIKIGRGEISSSKQPDISGIDGAIDNLRIYNFALSEGEIHGITMVGLKRSPIAITSSPQKMLRVGEKFEYSLKYTGGGPFVRFTFNNVPKWARVEGRIIGTPTQRDIGLSKPITIVGMSPWGPGQQSFSISVQPPLVKREWKIQANGKQLLTKYIGMGVEATLPRGSGQWSFTKEKPSLRRPLIMKLENTSSGINLQIRGTPSVTNYLFESSKDSGKTWQTVLKGRGLRHKTNALKNGNYLLRVSALPASSSPIISSAIEFNLNNDPPSQPRRPEVFSAKNSVRLKWNHHIGASEYNVFRRKLGSENWEKIYHGKSLGFVDKSAQGSLEKFDSPGLKAGANEQINGLTIYEYCISCIDKNGESIKSKIRNSDPRNW